MARLIFETIDGTPSEVIVDAINPVATVGRSADCTIQSMRKSVSRLHAEFRFLGSEGFEVIDLNSSNGTYIIINGERQKVTNREYLTDGDEVWCGDFIIHFHEDDVDDAYDNDFDAILQEKQDLEREVDQQAMLIAEKNQEISTLRQEINVVRLELEQFKSGATLVTSGDPEELKALTAKLQEATQREEDLQRELQELRSNPQAGGQDNEAVARLTLENESFASQVAALSVEVTRLKSELNDAQSNSRGASSHDIDLFKEEIDNLNQVNQTLRQRISELEEGRSLNELSGKELSSLRKHVVLLEAENEKLGDKLKKDHERLANLAKQHEELTQQATQLANEKKEASQNHAIAKAQVSRLRDDLTELRNNYDVLSERLQDISLQHDSAILERDTAIAKLESAVPANEIVELQKEISGLNSRLRSEKSRRDEALQEQEAKFKKQIDELQSRQRDLEFELKTQKASNPLNKLPEQAISNGLIAVESLRLVIDAIGRTNLDPLSTIDRVRLQGALHDLKAESSLETLVNFFNELVRP